MNEYINRKYYSHPLLTVNEDRNQLPRFFATATFATIKDRFFMVTPAHTFEENVNAPVFISIDPEPIDLKRRSIVKTSKIDIAAIELSDHEIDLIYQKAVFVTKNILEKADQNDLCVLEGFPAVRNKMKIRGKKIQKEMYQITFEKEESEFFPDSKFDETYHFAFSYNERFLKDDGWNTILPRQLVGMSGGMFKRVNSYGLEFPMGIFLAQSKKKHALIGLRYSIILDWLEYNLDQFK